MGVGVIALGNCSCLRRGISRCVFSGCKNNTLRKFADEMEPVKRAKML